MNTNHLKKFAQSARKLLLEDVSKRLLYWGIDGEGEVVHELTRTSGGYLFRGEVYNDQSIPEKWNNLISAIKRHSVEDVIEEAAYTWFNRLIAIKILEKNGYDPEVLAYVSEDLSDPLLLQNAKKGILPSEDSAIHAELKQAVFESNDDELFSKLLVHYCRSHHLLNNIFGNINDYTELLIPQTLLTKGGLLELINSEEFITDAEYGEVELIGWLYQFYISDKKDEVFAGFKQKKKARAEDIPAATQIFTPKWIVKYLVENTVGRIWLDLHPESPIRETLKYLVEPENHTIDEPIIRDVTELKVLDPAVGSGHFLVVAFDLLMEMYQEEGYTKRKAVESIVANNLYGLDICPRAVGLANFALLLKSASHHANILNSDLRPNIYAMPESFDFQRQQIQDFLGVGSDESVDEVHNAVKLLKMGKNIGSALILNLSEISRMRIEAALSNSKTKTNNLHSQMTINRLIPYAKIASILTHTYPAIVANPPYMSSRNMNSELSEYVTNNYQNTKSDLMTVFIEAISNLSVKNSRFGLINLPSWLFLSSYENLRIDLINNYQFNCLLHMGRGIFGIDFGSVAFVLKNSKNNGTLGSYFRLHERNFQHIYFKDIEKLFSYSNGNELYRYDFSQYRDEDGITEIPKQGTKRGMKLFYSNIPQINFSKIPGSPIAYWASNKIIEAFANRISIDTKYTSGQGMFTSDNKRFLRLWAEVSWAKLTLEVKSHQEAKEIDKKWIPYNKGGAFRKWYGNMEYVINWGNEGEEVITYAKQLYKTSSRSIKQVKHYFKESITWSLISSEKISARYLHNGSIYGDAGPFILLEKNLYILGLLNTKIVDYILKVLNPTLNFSSGVVSKIPIDFDQSFVKDSLITDCIAIAKKDWDSREISWDFTQTPLLNGSRSINQAYQIWREHSIEDFYRLHSIEEELNRVFIKLYGLEKEVSPDLGLTDITLLPEEVNRNELETRNAELIQEKVSLPIKIDAVIQQFLSFAIGCYMGRYRLDKPGLNIAHPNPSEEELSTYVHSSYEFEIDDDAIIPIMGSESPFSDDIVQRVQQFVLMIWGEDTYTENLNFINEALGEDLEKYLTKKFWDHHKKMYKKRPIYWQFASPKGAFKVLTYMHRMNRFTVQVIRKNYLFKQMNWLEREIGSLVENEATLQTKESKRLDKLRKDLIECREYDLLLKDMADRQIEFDLDDGVVENYKLFEGVVSKI